MDYSKPLKNTRHERFVLGLLESKTADQAYTDAGYKPDHRNAGRLTTNDDIQGRLAFLQNEVAEEAVIDAAWITKRLAENVNRAMQAVEVTDSFGKGGDITAIRLCLERIIPPLRHRPLHIALPAVETAADVLSALSVTIAAVAEGEVSAAFETRSVGGNPKKFCSPECKGDYHTALRRWA